METLYKISKSGKVIFWKIDHDEKSFWTITGQMGGKETVTAPTFCEAKNVGRANETTVAEQVLLEVASKVKKQQDDGYTHEMPTSKRFEVSLANKYQDRVAKGKLEFPYVMNPKLDGIRCYIVLRDGVIRMFSRKHKEFLSIPHIAADDAIKDIFDKFPDITLDGELYNHELKSDFNRIVSLVKKSKPTEADLEESARLIQFNCFDCFFANEPELGYIERNEKLVRNARKSPVLRFVSSGGITYPSDYQNALLRDVTGVETAIREYIEQGFEGIMLKRDGRPYCFGRSNDLLKYKFFKDAEYTIIDVEEGKGNLLGIAAAVWMEDERGVRFKVGLTGTQEYCRALFENKERVMGKRGTVKYQELTPVDDDGSGGVPRFGKLVAIRDYE